MKRLLIHNKTIIFLVIVAILFCSLVFKMFFMEFGPTLKQVDIASLDRNKNGKPDTIKVTFTVESNKELFAYGGIRLCIGNELRWVSCKFISQNLGFNPDVVHSGFTTFTRYLYLDEIPKIMIDGKYLGIEMVGDNPRIMYRRYKIRPPIDLSKFETLPLGGPIVPEDKSYPDYRRLHEPVE